MSAIRALLDPFTLWLVAVVLVATVLPAQECGLSFSASHYGGDCVVVFLHGAKLSRKAIIDGILHWRLHLLVLPALSFFFPC